LPSRVVAVAPLGNVSVVMIAWAASCQRPGSAPVARPSITPANASALSGSPITPVDARKTSPGLQPTALAGRVAAAAPAWRPLLPVNALALPEFTTSARALPALRWARHQSTGADGHFERVRTPATVVPGSSSVIRTSVRPA